MMYSHYELQPISISGLAEPAATTFFAWPGDSMVPNPAVMAKSTAKDRHSVGYKSCLISCVICSSALN